MASTALFAFLAQSLLIQAAFAQWQSGNSVVNNDVTVNTGAVSGVGLGGLNVAPAYGLGGLGYNSGFGLPGRGVVSGNSVVDNDIFINTGAVSGLGYAGGLGLGAGLGLGGAVVGSPAFLDLALLSGGGVLPISSAGPVVPAGLTVVSDNAIEGVVLVNGQLPFLSAVAFEGALASAGAGAASCGCGNGNIGIVSESGPALLPAAAGLGVGVGLNGLGRYF